MNLKKILISLLVLVLLVFVYLKYEKAKNKKTPQLPPIEVNVVDLVKQDIVMTKEWVGTTDGDVNANIHAKISGYLLKRDYEEGSFVKEGDLMFEIDPRPYQAALDQAQGQVENAIANQKKSQDDVMRYKRLVGEGAVSKKEYQDALRVNDMNKASLESAKANLEQAKLNLDWTKVYSPISGVAGASVIQVGDLVDPSSLLTKVSVIDPIKVIFPISENEYLWYKKTQLEDPTDQDGIGPEVTIILNDGTEYAHKGTFAFTDRQIDMNTGTMTIYVKAPNPDGFLRPGQYAKVRASVGTLKGVLAVPRIAVMETQGTPQLAVVDAENKVQIKNIKLGYSSKEIRVVEDGVKEGDKIIVSGFMKVQNGTVVNPVNDTEVKE